MAIERGERGVEVVADLSSKIQRTITARHGGGGG